MPPSYRNDGSLLVPEVALAGPDEGHAGSIGDGDDLVVADGAAGGDCRCDARHRRGRHAVEEGEVGVGGEDTAAGALAGALDREADARHAVWLAGAHAGHRAVFGEDDGVRLDVLAAAPGKAQVAYFFFRRFPL